MSSHAASGLDVEANDASFTAGGHNLSHNVSGNGNNVTMMNYYLHEPPTPDETLARSMINFFRRKSKSYRLSYDAALASRTLGTGQWLLHSSEYLSWKKGERVNLACCGIPGAGKTVMTAIIIEDLIHTFPLSPVLYIYNDSTSQKMQSRAIFIANMLSQVLHQYPHVSSSRKLRDLYDTYHNEQTDPPFEQCKEAFLAVMDVLLQPVFLVIDALDEYQIGNVSASIALVQDLETLDISLLITSRTVIPFSEDSYYILEIRASEHDVHATAARALERSAVGTLLRQRGLLDEMSTRIATQAAGIFLSSKLILSSIMTCDTIAAVKQLLSSSVTLDQIYQAIFTHIREQAPWVLPLIYFLLFSDQCTMHHTVMLQYLACEDWNLHKSDVTLCIDDYARSADTVLDACRGLVVLVQQCLPNEGKEFRFCHLIVRQSVQKYISAEELENGRLVFIHSILRYSLQTIIYLEHDSLPAAVGCFQVADEKSNTAVDGAHLKSHPLLGYHSLWFKFAIGVEERIETSDVYACYDHPRFHTYFQALSQDSRHMRKSNVAFRHAYYVSHLCEHGLGVLLQSFLTRHPTHPLHLVHRDSRTPLFLAINHGQVTAVRVLLEAGAAIDTPDYQGRTPITFALVKGQIEVAELLIDKGAPLNFANGDGSTPLLYALARSHLASKIAVRLIQAGATIDSADKDGRMPLSYALSNGHGKIAELLINKGAPLDSPDKYGWTPLIYACRQGHRGVAELLIDKGVALGSTDKVGWTPLTYASAAGHLDVVKLLIDRGGRAILESTHQAGFTPLMAALNRGHLAIAKLLIEKGGESD